MKQVTTIIAVLIIVLLTQGAFLVATPANVLLSVSESTVFLCNQTSGQIIAQYTLVDSAPLQLSQVLAPLSGHVNDTSTCFIVKIPKYTGHIIFTGSFGPQQFSTKELVATSSTPLLVWYYSGGRCWQTTTPYKACLTLQSQARSSLAQSIIFLCNETSLDVQAEYTLERATPPLTAEQKLGPLAGKFGDPSTCLRLTIPNYTGKIMFTGNYGNRHFPQKELTGTYVTPLYVWYYNEGSCWETSTSYKACLEL
jgi:hypothetical protein